MTTKTSELVGAFGVDELDKVVVNLGVAGEIPMPEGIELPARSRVTFEAEATVTKITIGSGKNSKGQIVLAVDPDSFTVMGVEIPEPDPTLDDALGDDGEDEGNELPVAGGDPGED